MRLVVVLRDGGDAVIAFPVEASSADDARRVIEAAFGAPATDRRRGPRSAETRAKMSAARREWWRRKKAARRALNGILSRHAAD